MQSHQRSMPLTSKMSGHKRRPSIGKEMPISSLLINLSNNNNRHDSMTRDGKSPEREIPPIYFHLSEVNDNSDKQLLDNPCLNCSGNTNSNICDMENLTVNKLCSVLCTDECKEDDNNSMVTIKQSKKDFLNNMLLDDNDRQTQELRAKFDIKEFRGQLAVAEALARASMLTSPAAKRRLQARKVEFELDPEESINTQNEEERDYVPPKELLLYLVRYILSVQFHNFLCNGN